MIPIHSDFQIDVTIDHTALFHPVIEEHELDGLSYPYG